MADRYRRAVAIARMSRPDQLLLIVAVYALGVVAGRVIAGVPGRPARVTAGAAVLVPVAASVHYANEYADHETDRLTRRTPFSGGSGVLPNSDLPRRTPLTAGIAALAVGTAGTAVALLAGRFPPVAAALLAAIAVFGWGYSVPPLALAWRGLGELDNAALGGVVLPAYGVAVVVGDLPATAAVAFLPLGALVFSNLLATNWADRHADAAVGKATLPTRWSRRRLRGAHLLGLAAFFGGTTALVVAGAVPAKVGVATWLVAPLAGWAWRAYTRRHSPAPSVYAMLAGIGAQFVAWACLLWLSP